MIYANIPHFILVKNTKFNSLSIKGRYSLGMEEAAVRIENAVKKVLAQGYRTGDIRSEGCKLVSCSEMGDAVVAAL